MHDERGPVDDEPMLEALRSLPPIPPAPDTATPAPSGDSDAASSLQLLALDGGTAAALAATRRGLEEGASDPVRVLAVDALSRVASGPELEAVLVETARADPSPFVQASVLSASRSLDAEAGARVARALLSRDDLDDVLRREATQLDRPVSR